MAESNEVVSSVTYQYGCTLCGWDDIPRADEDEAYAESMAHYNTEEHQRNAAAAQQRDAAARAEQMRGER